MMADQSLPRIGIRGWLLSSLLAVPSCVALGIFLGAGIGWLVGGDARICGFVGAVGGVVAIPFVAGWFAERIGSARHSPPAADPLNHAPPAELQRLVHRRFRLLYAFHLLLVPVPLAAWEWGVWTALTVTGTPAQALVTALGGVENWRSYVTADYAFTLADGTTVGRSQEVSDSYQRGLRIGGPIPVRYLPQLPSLSRIADSATYRWFLLRLAGVALLICLSIDLWLWRSLRREADRP